VTATSAPAGASGQATSEAVPGLPGFEHRYLASDVTRTHYVIGGAGPAVVLLHGWPYTWRVWAKTMPGLVEAGYTVIAVDLRGLGDSRPSQDTPPPDSAAYDKVTVARDIHDVVTDLGLDTIKLVGMDIGAMVAFAYARTLPTGVDHLVLSESVIPGHGLEEVMNPATGGFWHFGFHMQADLAAFLTAGKEAAYLSPMWQMGAQYGGLNDHDRAELQAAYTRPGAMRAGFAHYATLLDDAALNRMDTSPLPMPTLILNADHGLPQSLLTGGLSGVLPNMQTATITDSGHAYPADNPDLTVRMLAKFFTATH
jgi:pimeloyl-ACP methyl ester carboxylesterase